MRRSPPDDDEDEVGPTSDSLWMSGEDPERPVEDRAEEKGGRLEMCY
jgi:hypothetical protein